jgi:hypothetical protein
LRSIEILFPACWITIDRVLSNTASSTTVRRTGRQWYINWAVPASLCGHQSGSSSDTIWP